MIYGINFLFKHCIPATLNILTSAVSSTDTIEYQKKKHVMCQVVMSFVRCQVSGVTRHMSHVICHLSRVTNVNSQWLSSTATDPPHVNSPNMHNRIVHKELNIIFICGAISKEKVQTKKTANYPY